MSRGKFSDERYDEIKNEVIDMFEECDIHTYPIDCFAIAQKLHYVLHPYSSLPPQELIEALKISRDAFSKVEQDAQTLMYRYVIYYNDIDKNIRRIRWTIFHEIGHCYLGHHDNPAGQEELEEDEANFFAKYAISPPPLVNFADCNCPDDLAEAFCTSLEAAVYNFRYFHMWLNYGPSGWQDFELRLLKLFHINVAA